MRLGTAPLVSIGSPKDNPTPSRQPNLAVRGAKRARPRHDARNSPSSIPMRLLLRSTTPIGIGHCKGYGRHSVHHDGIPEHSAIGTTKLASEGSGDTLGRCACMFKRSGEVKGQEIRASSEGLCRDRARLTVDCSTFCGGCSSFNSTGGVCLGYRDDCLHTGVGQVGLPSHPEGAILDLPLCMMHGR